MKKTIAYLLILALALGLAACGANGENAVDPSGEQTGPEPSFESAETDEKSVGNEVEIGGTTVKLTYESHHGELVFKENVAAIEKASYGQACNLTCRSDEGVLFLIHIVYFEGKSIDEVIGEEETLSDKTVAGVDYRYFEYDENGVPGHTYVCSFNGTVYTVSFVSKYDTASLESVFLSNVRFEKE